jgi:ketosteroid isomerase-like protein
MSQQNISVVQQTYEAFGRGDVPGLLSLLDSNVEWTTPGADDLPTAGTRRGAAQVGEFFKTIGELLEFDSFEPQTFIADGDRVVVLGVDRVRVKGGSGKSLNEAWCHVFTIRDGRIAAFREYMDTAAFAAELKAITARA